MKKEKIRKAKRLKESKYMALKLDETEKKIYEEIQKGVARIENEVIGKLITGEYSLLLGKERLLHSFVHYLDEHGIDTDKDVGYLMIGINEEMGQPVMVMRRDGTNGEVVPLQVCLIKKSNILIDIVDQGIREKEGYDKYDTNKLMTIELEDTDTGRAVYSKFLEKNDKLNEENVRKVTSHIFNIERTLENVISSVRKEDENQKIMYG